MMKEPKNNARSVRMTDRVLAYVENMPGSSFNQKFEDMVLHCMESEALRERRIKELDDQIARKRAILVDLEQVDISICRIRRSLAAVSQECSTLIDSAEE